MSPALLPSLYGIDFFVTLMIREQLRSDLEGGPSSHPEAMSYTYGHSGSQSSFILACQTRPQTCPPPTTANGTDPSSDWPTQAPSPSPALLSFQSMILSSQASPTNLSPQKGALKSKRRGSLFWLDPNRYRSFLTTGGVSSSDNGW